LGSFSTEHNSDDDDDDDDDNDENAGDWSESTSSDALFVFSPEVRQIATRNANIGLVRMHHSATSNHHNANAAAISGASVPSPASSAAVTARYAANPADMPVALCATRSRQVAIGFSDVQGVRESMEDATVIQPAFCGDHRCDLVAIFDGHGGAAASSACARALPHHLGNHMAALLDELAADQRPEATAAQLVVALHAALADTQRELISNAEIDGGCTALVVFVHGNQCIVANVGDSRAVLGTLHTGAPLVRRIAAPSDDIASVAAVAAAAAASGSHADESDKPLRSATTTTSRPAHSNGATPAAVPPVQHTGKRHFNEDTAKSAVATTADDNAAATSTAIGGGGGGSKCRRVHVVRVTRDHKPDDAEETARVTRAGGFVARGRVCAVLAVSRALGDRFLVPYLSSTADYFSVENWRRHSVLILACDGVWDVLSDTEVVAIAHSTRDASKAARRICTAAISHGSMDNVSVIVIRFDGESGFVRRLRRNASAVQKRRKVIVPPPQGSAPF
jgi:serine/threonine protein phosphatase PrpC